ncbi:MAG: hypothetical protein JKY26_01520 [Pseudomonas sp.]|nr:hypothetical protein [Pseudomonas sp.]
MQQDFFESLMHDPLEAENAPHLDLSLDVIQIINQCIRNNALSRDQIIDRMNLCLRDSDKAVTKIAFNKWLSPSQANAIPFWVVSAFCWAAQTDAPYKVALQPIGRKVIDIRGDTMRELTEKRLQATEQMKQAKALEKQMQAMLEGKY